MEVLTSYAFGNVKMRANEPPTGTQKHLKNFFVSDNFAETEGWQPPPRSAIDSSDLQDSVLFLSMLNNKCFSAKQHTFRNISGSFQVLTYALITTTKILFLFLPLLQCYNDSTVAHEFFL